MSGPTYEEWLAAIGNDPQPSSDALPLYGWARKLGMCRTSLRLRAWIQDGLANGWMERALATVDAVTGGTRTITGFRLVEQGEQ